MESHVSRLPWSNLFNRSGRSLRALGTHCGTLQVRVTSLEGKVYVFVGDTLMDELFFINYVFMYISIVLVWVAVALSSLLMQ